jgi:hypothetical protein
MGYAVHFPIDPSSRYDLLLTKPNDPIAIKVQVKRATWARKTDTANEFLAVKLASTSSKRGQKKVYVDGDFDFLCAIDGFRMWLVPYADIRGFKNLSLDKRGPARVIENRKPYDPSKWLVR